MDDFKLLEMYFSRNEDAIKFTHEKYGAYCFSVANNILGSPEDAEECVNETYLRAWNSIPPKRPADMKLYLARITRNISLDVYRKKRTKKRGGETALALDELSDCVNGSESAENAAMGNELGRAIAGFLAGLSDRERAMFLLRYFYFEPIERMAERFGMSPGSLSAKLSRIRTKLKKHLEKEGYIYDGR